MKVSAAILLASLLALDASARIVHSPSPRHQLDSRQNNKGQGFNKGGQFNQQGFGKGGQTGGKQGGAGAAANNNANKGAGAAAGNKGAGAAGGNKGAGAGAAAASSSSVAAAASTTTSAAAAANTGKGGNGGNAAAAGAAGAAAGAAGGAAAANGGGGNAADEQDSLQLDPSLIGPNLALDGQAQAEAGQVPSLTTKNNFINFCAGTGQPNTNGLQTKTGSCNSVVMGQIPSSDKMVSCKFVFPPNGGTVKANTDFTIQLAIKNLATGNFVNPNTNFFGAPQQLNNQGLIIGHGHVTVEKLTSLDQTTPLNPLQFAFFKGLNEEAVNGILSADVTGGLPAGFYKVSSINTASNHQPVLMPIAQHGSNDDVSYFTVQ